MTVELLAGVRLQAGGLLLGGAPFRVLRLNPSAARVVARWRSGDQEVREGEESLAGRLEEAGLAVRRVPPVLGASDVTVVVPVRDRAAELDRCLASVGPVAAVLVVDDGSHDPAAVAAVADRHGARLLAHPDNRGPAAARNTGLAAARTELVAFVDSDCVLPCGWLDGLLPALHEGVAVVGPRIVGAGGPSLLARFETAAAPVDLGPSAGLVRRGARVGHLPAAVLLCRRAALGDGFDPSLRVGEDVDLVWRLAEQGVRYEPRVLVGHATRGSFGGWLRQRYGYGSSAALLDARHPGRLAPVVVGRWGAPVLALLALRRPALAVGAYAATAALMHSKLPDAPGRGQEAVRLTAGGVGWPALGLLDALARPWLPAALPIAACDRRVRGALALAVAVRLWRGRGTRAADVPVPLWAALRVADDLAYGTGLWAGVVRHRRLGPVVPRLG